MGLGKFIKDGGLFGLASGYDSDEHGGKPYSFNDLYEDSAKAVRISENLGHTVQNGKKLAVDNSNFLED